ncbi:MAG: PHP domain-containing protein [Patescibacteria group bacterium]
MAQSFDLQIQSTASDGKHTPAQIIDMAKDLGIGVIAMTDHDTIGGVAEALSAGTPAGVTVIGGIEMSVEDHGAHILGYGIDHTHPALLEKLADFQQGRIEGAQQMVQNLAAAGFVVMWEDVQRQASGTIARPHIARAILGRPENKEKLGGAATTHDFIEKFLTDDSPYYVSRAHISAQDAIALIHAAGGVAVWSHPAIHFQGNHEGLERFLKELIGWGIEGVEVFSPAHTEDDAEFLYALAGKYALLRTGGSDFHERGDHRADARGLHSARTLGDFETYGFSVEDIVQKLEQAIAATKNRRA